MSAKSITPGVDIKTAAATAADLEASALQLEPLDGLSPSVDRRLAKHPHASPALLERLSHSSDNATRKNVALNANSPKETLVRLAPQFPGDFFLNPAFDWLLFEDPDLVKNLGPGVRRNVLKRPECPESLISWAVEKGSDEERLAVAMNPGTAANLVARLSRLPGKVGEAARSHVNAVPSTPFDPADGRLVVQAEVRAALAELTADEARSYWKRGIVGPSKWACLSLSARLDVLWLDDWVYRDDWLAQQPTQLSSPAEKSLQDCLKSRQHISDSNHALATSVLSAPADLERLAAAASPELLALVARNPSMPAAVLGRLAHDKRADVRAAVAANESTPAEALQQLAKDKQASVRAEAAGNPSLAMDAVLGLTKDKATEVKQAAKAAAPADMRAARSVRTPGDQLAELAGAKKAEVRLAVARNPSTPKDARARAFASLLAEAGPNKLMEYADEPCCPPQLRDRARARRWWWELCRTVEKHAVPDVADPLPEEPDIETLVQMLRAESAAMLLNPEQTLLSRSLGFHEGDLLAIPGDEADTACNAKARAVRLMGLMHPLAGPEAMVKRSRSPDWVERLAIACNPACAASILNSLEKDANQTVTRQVASTRVAKGSEQERKSAIVRTQPEGEISLAPVVEEIRKRLGKCRAWLLQGSAWWPSLSFQQRLGRPDWPTGLEHKQPADLIAILEALSSMPVGERESTDPLTGIWSWRRGHELQRLIDGDPYVRAESIERAVLTEDVIQATLRSRSVEVRANLASNRALPHAVQAQLATDPNHDVRKSLAANPSVSQDVLASLAADKKWEVRGPAAANPSISPDAMEVLATDKEDWVRLRVAGNPAASVSLLARLVKDRDSFVRSKAERQLVDRDGISGSDLALMLGDSHVRHLVAGNRHTPMVVMRQLAADASPGVRRSLALNCGAPADILTLLVDDQDDAVKAGALAHHNAPLAALERATKEKDPRFRRAVAVNPSGPLRLLEELAADPDPAVRLDLLGNPCLPLRLLDRLTSEVDGMETYFPALVNAARSPRTGTEELQRLGRESFLIVRFVALANPRYPGKASDADRVSLHQEMLNNVDALSPPMATAGSEPEFRRALHALDLLPAKPDAKWAAKAAKSKDWLARFAVPLSGVPQTSLLQLLIDDPVEVVRQLAIKRLRAAHIQGLKP